MKRLCSLSIVLVLLCVCFAAHADDFTIHSGVTFSMKKSEVIEKEKAAGITLEEYSVTDGIASSILKGECSIAGYNDAQVWYTFDSNDNLTSVRYALGMLDQNKQSDFETVDQLYKNKYGDPDNSLLPIVAKLGFEPFSLSYQIFNYSDPPLFSCWSIPQKDGTSVVIVHYMFGGNVFGSTLIYNDIGYKVFTADQLESGAGEVVNEITQMYDDI